MYIDVNLNELEYVILLVEYDVKLLGNGENELFEDKVDLEIATRLLYKLQAIYIDQLQRMKS